MLYNTKKDNMSADEVNELASLLFGKASANWKRNKRIDILTDKINHSQKFSGLLGKYNSDPLCLSEFFTEKKRGKEEFSKLSFPQESILLTGDSGSCKSSFLELIHELLQIRLKQIQRLRQYAIKTGGQTPRLKLSVYKGKHSILFYDFKSFKKQVKILMQYIIRKQRNYWKEKLSILLKEHSVLFFKETDLRTIVSKAVKWPNPQNENAFYNLLDRISEVNYIIIDEAFYSSNWKFPENSASEYEAYFKIYADLLISEKKKKGKIFLASSNNTAGGLDTSAPIIRRFSELFDRTIFMNRVPGL